MDWSKYPNFEPHEFECRCGCKTNNVSEMFLDLLQKARLIAGISFRITSGCRCPKHNATVSKNQQSDHVAIPDDMFCFGVDIQCDNDRNRDLIIDASYRVGIDRRGVYPDRNIVHLGIGKDKGGRNDSRVFWRK